MNKSIKRIKGSLKTILENFTWESVSPSGSTNVTFEGLNNLRPLLLQVREFDLFSTFTEPLINSIIFSSSQDRMSIINGEAYQITNNLKQLKTLLTEFQDQLIKIVPEEDVNSINIKFPEIKDFDELSKISREFHLSPTQIILNDEIDGQTKITSVENGSIWFTVFLGSATAVAVIASVTWSATIIYKKYLECCLLEQQIRGLNIKNESLEDIVAAQKADTELVIQAEAEHIQSEYFRNNAPENIERIKKSITNFAELINKGAEIQPALFAPESVANLFPDPSKIMGIESKIKKLSASDN